MNGTTRKIFEKNVGTVALMALVGSMFAVKNYFLLKSYSS